MKVLDLLCAHDHAFEGWFGSEDDFQSQLARGLVQCPMCGDADIRKGLSAPRLNLRAGASAERAVAPAVKQPQQADDVVTPQALQAAWLHMARHIMARTEDVGQRFAAEARRMHYGEIEERAIRGQATAEETSALLDEGIAVLPLVLPEAAKEPLQ
ncbi:MAG TPA: DUF1178 family protein [Alicycliphilus sp.]|nr:DUF1178 family protein [Alicycliphilus sp.]